MMKLLYALLFTLLHLTITITQQKLVTYENKPNTELYCDIPNYKVAAKQLDITPTKHLAQVGV